MHPEKLLERSVLTRDSQLFELLFSIIPLQLYFLSFTVSFIHRVVLSVIPERNQNNFRCIFKPIEKNWETECVIVNMPSSGEANLYIEAAC